jgi:hypothetical protein
LKSIPCHYRVFLGLPRQFRKSSKCRDNKAVGFAAGGKPALSLSLMKAAVRMCRIGRHVQCRPASAENS